MYSIFQSFSYNILELKVRELQQKGLCMQNLAASHQFETLGSDLRLFLPSYLNFSSCLHTGPKLSNSDNLRTWA